MFIVYNYVLSNKPCLHAHQKLPGVGAFEQLFDRPGEGGTKIFQKFKCSGVCPGGGDVEASI